MADADAGGVLDKALANDPFGSGHAISDNRTGSKVFPWVRFVAFAMGRGSSELWAVQKISVFVVRTAPVAVQ